MIESIFQFDGRNFKECQDLYRGPRQRDYYAGDYSIDPADFVEVNADKVSVGSSSIIRLVSRSRLKFRRTWRHIREDGIDLTVLWFVKSGSIRMVTTGAEKRIARLGDFLMTRSVRPFAMECLPERESRLEVIHVTVPTHLIRRFIPDGVPSGQVIPANDGRSNLAVRIIVDLYANEERISSDSSCRLLEGALSLLADVVADCVDPPPKKPTITERRIEEVLRLIDLHLCNPKLNTTMVSQGCAISPRYLSTLLQMHGASFSSLVWGKRMAKAKEWLSTSTASEVSVSDVAHGLGFKSVAHFSRRFKRVYQLNPSDCRAPFVAVPCSTIN